MLQNATLYTNRPNIYSVLSITLYDLNITPLLSRILWFRIPTCYPMCSVATVLNISEMQVVYESFLSRAVGSYFEVCVCGGGGVW